MTLKNSDYYHKDGFECQSYESETSQLCPQISGVSDHIRRVRCDIQISLASLRGKQIEHGI